MRPPVHLISSSMEYPESENESMMNRGVGSHCYCRCRNQYKGIRECQEQLDQTRDLARKIGYTTWNAVEVGGAF